MKYLGISRSVRFSPNSAARDAAIFSAVASRVLRGGGDVSVISEDLFVDADLGEFDVVFSMARGRDVLSVLAGSERRGETKVINSACALLSSTRARLVTLLEEAGVPQPPSQVLHLGAEGCAAETLSLHFPLWLKRGEACAQRADDVVFLAQSEALPSALQNFRERGLETLVAVEHREGDLVKFYGVEGTPFFYHDYPTQNGSSFSKFGLEKYNGAPRGYAFSTEHLKAVADAAARRTGFTIYGGDAIVDADGGFTMIDFNDWPSFSACRRTAARAIAERIKRLAEEDI